MADGGDGFMGRCEVVEPRRRGKRQGRLALPGHLMDALHGSQQVKATEPAFVPLSLLPEPAAGSVLSPPTEAATGRAGVMTIEVGPDVVLRIPCDVAVARAAALVHAAGCIVIVAGQRLPILIATRPVDFFGCRPWYKRFLTVCACDRSRASFRPVLSGVSRSRGRYGDQRIGSKSSGRAHRS